MESTRRELLAAAGAVGAAGVAGCLGDDTANQAGGGSEGESKLAYLRVANEHREDHSVHVLVQRDGEPIHWSNHDLAAGDDGMTSETVEQSWSTTDARVTVYVRLDDDADWDSFDIDDGRWDCYGAMVKVNPDGEFGVWFEQNPSACEGTTASD
ncbi:hypothetical protein [Halorarum salinum]|uniref:Uncharacterized protein n=1 Tax=Halorarum salinum TaxID=2743089 RepID=A0A7D5QBY0_9EURY|nr:hypothetical protein [Halobaculum salinum]QLG61201.1 hypothetical protein HUG12_05400 [Halobaculum salinum]